MITKEEATKEVQAYIQEEMKHYKICFGGLDGFKEYITRKLNSKLGK